MSDESVRLVLLVLIPLCVAIVLGENARYWVSEKRPRYLGSSDGPRTVKIKMATTTVMAILSLLFLIPML